MEQNVVNVSELAIGDIIPIGIGKYDILEKELDPIACKGRHFMTANNRQFCFNGQTTEIMVKRSIPDNITRLIREEFATTYFRA